MKIQNRTALECFCAAQVGAYCKAILQNRNRKNVLRMKLENKQTGTSGGTQQPWSSLLVVVVVVRVVGDVGNEEKRGGGGGGACGIARVGRKQQNRFSNSRELFGFRVTTTAHRNNKTMSEWGPLVKTTDIKATCTMSLRKLSEILIIFRHWILTKTINFRTFTGRSPIYCYNYL